MTPHLILLPGLDGTARLLAPFVEATKPGFASVQAIAYPHDRPMDYMALELYARERLPQNLPFVLLGESFSGPVAIRIAADPPPNLVGLVLSTTFARAPVPLAPTLAPLTRLAPVRMAPMSILSFVLLGCWSTSALRRSLHAALHEVTPDVLHARTAAAMRTDVADLLPRITVPTLCLRAKHDRLLRPNVAHELLQHIPNAREIAIAGPHLLLQTRIDACAQATIDFSEKIP